MPGKSTLRVWIGHPSKLGPGCRSIQDLTLLPLSLLTVSSRVSAARGRPRRATSCGGWTCGVNSLKTGLNGLARGLQGGSTLVKPQVFIPRSVNRRRLNKCLPWHLSLMNSVSLCGVRTWGHRPPWGLDLWLMPRSARRLHGEGGRRQDGPCRDTRRPGGARVGQPERSQLAGRKSVQAQSLSL